MKSAGGDREGGAEEVLTDGSAQSFCTPSFFPNCLLHWFSVKRGAITGSVPIRTIFLRKDWFVSYIKPMRKKCDEQLNWIPYFWRVKSLFLVCSLALCCTLQSYTLKWQEKGQTQRKIKKIKNVLSVFQIAVFTHNKHAQWLWKNPCVDIVVLIAVTMSIVSLRALN